MERDWIATSRENVEKFRRRHRIGLVTLLFTDIIDSTALKQKLGDAPAVTLIQRHHSAVRALLKRFAESEEIETAGDSFFIVFAKPSDAVRFSLLLQAKMRALASESRCAVFDRVGIHVGEVFIDDQPEGGRSRELFGLQIDTCARVMSLGGAHQILLSRFAFDSARQVLKGEDIAGIRRLSWLNHGNYLLKGIDEPVEICEVGEDGEAALLRPPDSEKARRQVAPGDEPVLGWRPAASQTVPGTEWVLEKNLGEGGFGEVWLGRHKTLKQARVFKFCFNADRVRSLKREVTIFRVLKESVGDHPNIVAIEDVLFDEPPFYIVMEYIDGDNLVEWYEAQGADAVTIETRLEVVAQIADALQAAHESGVIHRDIKPQNILIDRRNGSMTAKLTDFGIGKILSEEVLTGITRLGFTQTVDSSGSHSGTPIYMAPEIIAGQQATTQSDIYSLGVVLYQLLVGDFARPLTTDWDEEVTDLLLRDDLRHCFSRNPAKRFPAAKELAEKLRTLPERQAAFSLQQATFAAREQAAERGARRKRRLAVAAALVVAAGAGYASYLWLQKARADSEVDKLRNELHAAPADPYLIARLSRKLLERKPGESLTWAMHAKALLDANDIAGFDEAMVKWKENVSPLPTRVQDLLGDRDSKQQRNARAIEHWTAYLRDPDVDAQSRKATWQKLAEAEIALGQWEQAKDYLTQWIKAEDNITARIQRAKVNEELRDWASSSRDVDRAREIDPTYPELKNFKAPVAPQTIEDLDGRIAESPRDPKLWQRRATELTRLRRFKAALEDIEKARNLDPDSVRFMIDQAHLLWQLQLPIPEELGVRSSAAWTSDERKFAASFDAMQADLEALSQLDAKLQAAPDEAGIYLERSALLSRLHQQTLAERDSQKAKELQAQPPTPP